MSDGSAYRAWYQKNKERIKARVTAYGKANPEKRRQWCRTSKLKTKAHDAIVNREWKRKNPAKIRDQKRRAQLKKRNLTTVEYAEMLKQQAGLCAICGEKNKDGRRLAVDHDHATGITRGLLCSRCNLTIGVVGENRDTLHRMIEYLS